MKTSFLIALAASCAAMPVQAQTKPSFPEPLAEEPIPTVEKLPETYPASWIMVHDFNFMALHDGRGVVVDTANPSTPIKGTVQIA